MGILVIAAGTLSRGGRASTVPCPYAPCVFQRIVLLKLTTAWSTPEGRDRLAGALAHEPLRRHGVLSLDAGLPADAAAVKSWDLAVTMRFDALEGAQAFDVLELVARTTGEPHEAVVALHKTWTFETFVRTVE